MSQYTPVTLDAFERVNSDSNGNPRYVIHYTNFVLPENVDVFNRYAEALYIAKKVWPHSKKYHNKSYGGGIVVSSYNLNDELKKLNEYNLSVLNK